MSNFTSTWGNSFCILRNSSMIDQSDEPVVRSEYILKPKVCKRKPSSNIPRPEPGLMSTSRAENMMDSVGKCVIVSGYRQLLTVTPPEAEWIAE